MLVALERHPVPLQIVRKCAPAHAWHYTVLVSPYGAPLAHLLECPPFREEAVLLLFLYLGLLVLVNGILL